MLRRPSAATISAVQAWRRLSRQELPVTERWRGQAEGNRALDRAIVKVAGMLGEGLAFIGPPRCLDPEEAAFDAVVKRSFKDGEVSSSVTKVPRADRACARCCRPPRRSMPGGRGPAKRVVLTASVARSRVRGLATATPAAVTAVPEELCSCRYKNR